MSRALKGGRAWKRCHLAGVGLLGLGACLLCWATSAHLARALPLAELLVRPRALPGMLAAIAGFSLVTIARRRVRRDPGGASVAG